MKISVVLGTFNRADIFTIALDSIMRNLKNDCKIMALLGKSTLSFNNKPIANVRE